MMNYKKYKPFPKIQMENREWPDKVITKAPIWCSVDLRDGNQALAVPMGVHEKMEFFNLLLEIGFKEIEVGFPSASETEYRFMRTLVEKNLIPDDVKIQVLTQSRKHLIEKTFESLEGVKTAIVHLYNSTSTLQRKVVFKTDKRGVIEIAQEGASLIKELESKLKGTKIIKEYSPESFTGTELDFAVEVCEAVMDIWKPTTENKMIINLPATVEMAMPNIYADQIEWFIKHLKNRESVIISIHAHNDRGTSVAASELALLAGADRIEGTLFGNGERTGNADILTIALNMFSQGIDPQLDFSNINKVVEVYERCTRMKVHPRHPYAGELVYTAFSGSHQDAIRKGLNYYEVEKPEYWEVPYLPIDPADVGRQYEPIIRINSQSGKGGVAFIMEHYFGFKLPKEMQPEFSQLVQKVTDRTGKELKPEEIFDLFKKEYLERKSPVKLLKYRIEEDQNLSKKENNVSIFSTLEIDGKEIETKGIGNGPIDAFFHSLQNAGLSRYKFVTYEEHALSEGSDSKAVSYICLENGNGEKSFGVGIDANITTASLNAIISAINRFYK
ncbi:MAG: 2-isopropylmalate synthase [Brevinematales bacterium]|nr:2-isopropylmalate synthase [Brevinematales bacterium]